MSNQEELEKIVQKIKLCQKCPLHKTATNPVPGNGNPNAEIMFIGEAPGFNEDQQGIPFCGAAGNLLNQLLVMIGFKREDIFITNILKHRPPQNRDPLPEEIFACAPYLKEQILIIKPKIIVTLGRFSLNFFLPSAYISKVHGKEREISYEGLNLMIYPTFHPAAALRNSIIMNQIKEDFKKIPEIIRIANQPPTPNKNLPSVQVQQKTLF